MTDLEIKNKINETLQKLHTEKLNQKIKMFQQVELPFISIRYKSTSERVSRKKLRLYLDLINVWYPLDAKLDDKHKANLISQIFKCKCNETDLVYLRSFKDITKKKVLTLNKENVKTISRLRWRGRENLNKNLIHFQR